MRVVDANVLLYAVNLDATEHETAKSWMEERLGGTEAVGFAWVALLAFLRISTRPGLLEAPLTSVAAFDYVEEWLNQPASAIVHPGRQHLSTLRALLEPIGTAGNLTTDAHLAALAADHRAQVVSFDADFGRFAGVRWLHPADDLTS